MGTGATRPSTLSRPRCFGRVLAKEAMLDFYPSRAVRLTQQAGAMNSLAENLFISQKNVVPTMHNKIVK